MALTPSRSGRFKKDYRLMERRGKDMFRIREIMKAPSERVRCR